MVIARQKELGSALGAGEPVFTLIDPDTVWVLAFIDESKAAKSESANRSRSFCDRFPAGASRARLHASSRKAIASTKSVVSRSRSIVLARGFSPWRTGRGLHHDRSPCARAVGSRGGDRGARQQPGNRMDSRRWTPSAARSDARTPAARRAVRDHGRRPGRRQRGQAIAQRTARRPRCQDQCEAKPHESGLSRHPAQSAALHPDLLRLEPSARHRDHDHRNLPGLAR